MVDHDLTAKGLHEAKCLIEDRVPLRYRGRALYALNEILEFLKPAEAEMEGDWKSTWWYVCGECHTAIDPKDHYCRECGKRMKWK